MIGRGRKDSEEKSILANVLVSKGAYKAFEMVSNIMLICGCSNTHLSRPLCQKVGHTSTECFSHHILFRMEKLIFMICNLTIQG